MSTITLDFSRINAAGNAARKVTVASEKASAMLKLTEIKLKTIGKTLSTEEINNIRPLVWEMYKKGWLTAEDKQWCREKHIYYFS